MQLAVTDIGYEQQLSRDVEGVSYVRDWLSYIHVKKLKYIKMNFTDEVIDQEQVASEVDPLWIYYDRAVEQYPRSYKIWADYCDTRSSFVIQFLSNHEMSIRRANGTYERALLNLWTCPRLWLDYLDFIGKQRKVTLLRKTFNKSLQSLPITQHDRMWECYLPLIRNLGSIETVDDAYRRFLKLHPEHVEDACEFFIDKNATKKAAFYLTKLLEDPDFKSLNNRTKYYWWTRLSEVIGADPNIENAEQILRNGCKDFVVETGRVWVLIAEHYARLGLFSDSIQTFEDAMNSTITSHDFALVFEGETSLLMSIASHSDKFYLFIQKQNDLLNRHLLLLNGTKLRHDKNNVTNWIERVSLFLDREYNYEPKTRKSLWETLEPLTTQQGQLAVMEEAIETVEPRKAEMGKYCDLWTNLSKIVDTPFAVLEAALTDEALLPGDVVGIYCYYAELELTNEHYESALSILHRATDDKRTNGSSGSSQLWSLAIDVEWSMNGSSHPSLVKQLFEKCLVSRSCCMQHILAYTTFLEGLKRYDEMFRVYERGINQVGWPHCSTFWLFYIHKFISLYGGKRRERARDLFEDALKDAPPKEAMPIFILYAKFEEDFGLMKRAMDIYKRAADICQNDEIFHVWVASACRLFGASKTREVYKYAVDMFGNKGDNMKCAEWCIRFAKLEAKLTEFERARSVFIHGTQYADPAVFPRYWEEYENFEKLHGTKENYKEMLSQKNVAVARFNKTTHIGIAAEGKGLVSTNEDEELADVEGMREAIIAEAKIPATIYESPNFTENDRIEKRKRYGMK